MAEDWLTHDLEHNLTPINKSRTDLAMCYRILVMNVLMDHEIIIKLLDLALRVPEHLVTKAITLAKELIVTLQRLFLLDLHVAQNADVEINNFFMKSSNCSKRYNITVLLQKLYLLERDEETSVSRYVQC